MTTESDEGPNAEQIQDMLGKLRQLSIYQLEIRMLEFHGKTRRENANHFGVTPQAIGTQIGNINQTLAINTYPLAWYEPLLPEILDEVEFPAFVDR